MFFPWQVKSSGVSRVPNRILFERFFFRFWKIIFTESDLKHILGPMFHYFFPPMHVVTLHQLYCKYIFWILTEIGGSVGHNHGAHQLMEIIIITYSTIEGSIKWEDVSHLLCRIETFDQHWNFNTAHLTSKNGAIVLHGPHQDAVKSMTPKISLFSSRKLSKSA